MSKEKEVPMPSRLLEFIGINLSEEAKKENDERYEKYLEEEKKK